MFFRPDGAVDIRHREHDEDEGLKERTEDSQTHHRPRQNEWKHYEEDPGGRVLSKDISEEPQRQ